MAVVLGEHLNTLFEKIVTRVSKTTHSKTTFSTVLSYLVTWTIYFIILICGLLYGRIGVPRRTEFDPLDRKLIFPYVLESDTFAPLWQLVIWAILIPLIMMAIFTFMLTQSISVKSRLILFHRLMVALMCAISLELFVVSSIKNVASVARPDIISRCELKSLQDSRSTVGLSFCNQHDEQILYEGFRSFPSGHSSIVFASSTVQSLYSMAVLNLNDHNGFAWKFIFCILYPLTIALVISFSRVSDNRHRVSDVLAGSIIGIISGISAYTFYFPGFHAFKFNWSRFRLQRSFPENALNIENQLPASLLPIGYNRNMDTSGQFNNLQRDIRVDDRRLHSY